MTSQLPRFWCIFLSCQQQKKRRKWGSWSLRSFLFRDDFSDFEPKPKTWFWSQTSLLTQPNSLLDQQDSTYLIIFLILIYDREWKYEMYVFMYYCTNQFEGHFYLLSTAMYKVHRQVYVKYSKNLQGCSKSIKSN